MSTVEKTGASWPGIGFAIGGGIGVAVGAALIPVTGSASLWIAGGFGAVAGLIGGSLAAMRARRSGGV